MQTGRARRAAAPRRDELDRAFRFLDRHAPAKAVSILRVLRKPGYWWVRWPVGLVLMVSSALWFLPVLGVEFLPFGLLLIAQDVPFLRRPVGWCVLRLELWFMQAWRWWRRRRRRGNAWPA